MRRFVIVFLCLTIAGCVVLMAARARRIEPAEPSWEAENAVEDEIVEGAGLDAPAPAEAEIVSLASRTEPSADDDGAGREGDRVLEELAQLRAEVVDRVDRRPLFAMAQARGLPNHELFTMSSQQLLDAILDAEGLPPADVQPSPHSAERIRMVASEAFRRHDEFAAEEAAERDAG
jgi:hypothetical protein